MAPFTISLHIHHVSQNLHFLTQALATQPAFCMTAGEPSAKGMRKTSVWHAPLCGGNNQHDFDHALELLLNFIKGHRHVFEQFAGDDSMMEVLFTFRVPASEAEAGNMAHSVNLQPFLLYELSSRQIGIKVQTAYSADV